MDLHQVRYFLAIAQSGSFTAASEVAFVTQPTLSSAIAKLEAELGVHLFERGTRGVRLTEGGQRFLPRARAILREMEIARADFRGGEQKVSPRIRIAVLSTVPMTRVAPLLRGFIRSEPALRWSLSEGSVEELESQLNAGRLDLTVTNLAAGRGHYAQLPIYADNLRLAVPAASRLSRSRTVKLDVLQDRPLIVRTHCEHLQHASRAMDRGHVRPAVIHRTRFDERALALVAAGIGACFIPDSFALKGVKMLAVAGIQLPRTIGLQWLDAASRPVVSALLERFAAERARTSRRPHRTSV
jgi:LysR family hydrogen peroxide-inducible transcriptional activator